MQSCTSHPVYLSYISLYIFYPCGHRLQQFFSDAAEPGEVVDDLLVRLDQLVVDELARLRDDGHSGQFVPPGRGQALEEHSNGQVCL